MPTSEKPKPPEKAQEFFYSDGSQRADADLHNEILDDGDHAAAEAVSRKVAKRLGLSEQQIDKLMGRKPAK